MSGGKTGASNRDRQVQSMEKQMSLEDKIAELTEAVKEQTALMKKLAGGKPAAGAKTTDDKPAASDKPASGGKSTGKPAAGGRKKKMTKKELLESFGEYLMAPDDKEDQNRLSDTVAPLNDHFGLKRLRDIDESQVEEAAGYLAKLREAYDEGGVDAAVEVDLELSNEDDGSDDGDSVL